MEENKNLTGQESNSSTVASYVENARLEKWIIIN